MSYLLPCPCGSSIAVQKSQAGTRVKCPHCQQSLEIPTIRGLGQCEFIEESSASDIRKSRASSRWTPLRGIIAATCFVIAIIGLGRASIYAVYRFSYPTNYTVEDMYRDSEESFRELSPVATWDNWRYLQETGLGRKNPPQVFVFKRFLEQKDVEMRYWGGAGAIGLLGLFATILWARRSEKK